MDVGQYGEGKKSILYVHENLDLKFMPNQYKLQLIFLCVTLVVFLLLCPYMKLEFLESCLICTVTNPQGHFRLEELKTDTVFSNMSSQSVKANGSTPPGRCFISHFVIFFCLFFLLDFSHWI